MNPINAGLRIAPAYAAPQATPANAVSSRTDQLATPPSTSVNLGQSPRSEDAATYSSRGTLAVPLRYVLENDNLNKLSMNMMVGVQASAIGSRFHGLGAALVNQLVANGGQSFTQSVFAFADGAQPSAEALKVQSNNLRQHPANAVNLSLTTASGATVNLSLASNEQGLAVSAEVQGGQLSSDELKGLASLAESFQGAINGLSEQPPRLQLGKLATLDSTLFSALQMNAKLDTVNGQQLTFDLTLDDSARKLSLQGPAGNVQLNLDTRDTSLLGKSAQRQAAISNYLSQFDAAQSRGKGDENLVGLLKDAFVQLNSADDIARPATGSIPLLAAKDTALLSGLADFSASISQTSQQPNPLRPTELDRFDYKVSQSTTISGASPANRAVQQDQQANLSAAYHTSLNPQMALVDALATQNYRYHEISDQSSTSTRLRYDKNSLVEASVSQQASRNERVRSYADGVLQSDVSTPASVSESRNLLGLLTDLFERERISQRDRGVSILEAQLQSQRSQWQLQSDPALIRPQDPQQ
ncbi:hypothetical protein JYG36_11375 [Pseudomonas sp. SORT22]|uniref:hypothetical protein n=1 Tax=Pseudomonas sp. SORT22 TaxID=2813842 RepID=UPI001BCEF9F0|nr:hypothetical protein [Pseudomonas sp. SORT22]QVM98724.1 hypothetical protein JYG36_11375 [Pseudomonas sp. SORT22]